MENIFYSLACGLALLSSSGVMKANASAEQSLDAQKKQWQYVSNHLAKNLAEQTGIVSKLGTFMQDYRSLNDVPCAAISAILLAGYVGCKRVAVLLDNLSQIEKISELLWILGAGFFGACIGTTLISKVGQWVARLLEGKDKLCLATLKNFVAKWESHKENVPADLVALFDKLSNDYDDNNDLTIVDAAKARIIIEGIFARCLAAQAV